MPRIAFSSAAFVLINLVAGAASAQLALPPALNPQPQPPQQNATTRQLDAAEQEDSGRGLEFFYANAGPLVSGIGLGTVSGKSGLAFGSTFAVGPGFDAGLGLRLLYFTIGPRLKMASFPGFQLWTIDGEAAFHLPLGNFDPQVGIHGGYNFASGISSSAIATDTTAPPPGQVSLAGANVGLQGGLDYYLTPNFTVGGELGGEFMFIHRPSVDGTKDPTYQSAGNAVGLGGEFAVRAGLHF